MPAPLEMFLRQLRSGNATLTPELYALYGGDKILEQVQKYDPEAKWSDVPISGGEAGEGAMGKRLDFDVTKIPKTTLPNGREMGFWEIAPSNGGSSGLKVDKYKWQDDLFGEVTDSRNLNHGKPAWWELVAPIAVATLAPMLGGALAGAGIGLGAAGSTSAVTGGAAGLAAGNIPGAFGAGNSLGLSNNFLKLLGRSPQTVGRQISARKVDMNSMIPMLFRLFGK